MKKNKTSVVIIVLSILLVGLGGYLVYYKIVLKDNGEGLRNNNSSTAQETKFSISKAEIDDMTNLIEIISSLTDATDLSKMDNQSKLRLAVSLADDNFKKGSD